MWDQPTLVFAWQLAASAAAGLIAMALAFVVIIVLVEVYDVAIRAPRPPAVWRRPWCWSFGHDDKGRAGLRVSCRRCGSSVPTDRRGWRA
jgi:hypothetical protein